MARANIVSKQSFLTRANTHTLSEYASQVASGLQTPPVQSQFKTDSINRVLRFSFISASLVISVYEEKTVVSFQKKGWRIGELEVFFKNFICMLSFTPSYFFSEIIEKKSVISFKRHLHECSRCGEEIEFKSVMLASDSHTSFTFSHKFYWCKTLY